MAIRAELGGQARLRGMHGSKTKIAQLRAHELGAYHLKDLPQAAGQLFAHALNVTKVRLQGRSVLFVVADCLGVEEKGRVLSIHVCIRRRRCSTHDNKIVMRSKPLTERNGRVGPKHTGSVGTIRHENGDYRPSYHST